MSEPNVARMDLGLSIIETYYFENVEFSCASGGVTDFEGDLIVNAANEGCIGGSGLDGAINDKGGWEVISARRTLKEVSPGVRCNTGEVVHTRGGGDLKCKFIIHAVGPIFFTFSDEEDKKLSDQLSNVYIKAFQEIDKLPIGPQQSLKTIAFPLISCGVFRGRKKLDDVVEIAVKAIQKYLTENRDKIKLEKVFLCAFSEKEKKVLKEVASKCLKDYK